MKELEPIKVRRRPLPPMFSRAHVKHEHSMSRRLKRDLSYEIPCFTKTIEHIDDVLTLSVYSEDARTYLDVVNAKGKVLVRQLVFVKGDECVKECLGCMIYDDRRQGCVSVVTYHAAGRVYTARALVYALHLGTVRMTYHRQGRPHLEAPT